MASGFMPVQIIEDTGKKRQGFGKGLLVGMDPKGSSLQAKSLPAG